MSNSDIEFSKFKREIGVFFYEKSQYCITLSAAVTTEDTLFLSKFCKPEIICHHKKSVI